MDSRQLVGQKKDVSSRKIVQTTTGSIGRSYGLHLGTVFLEGNKKEGQEPLSSPAVLVSFNAIK